jgi:hypothetical protein
VRQFAVVRERRLLRAAPALLRKTFSHHDAARGLPLRIGSCSAILLAALVVAVAVPVEHGASQTPATTSTEAEPPPAPDPVPDANPNPPQAGGDGSGDSSGSSGGSGGGSPSAKRDGTASAITSTDGRKSEAKPEPRRQKQHADKLDLRAAAAAHEPRDPASRSASEPGNTMGLGFVAQPQASTLVFLELFVVGLAGALALALMLLAAIPLRVLAGLSFVLAARRREAEILIAAVLWSLVIGLLTARFAAQLG